MTSEERMIARADEAEQRLRAHFLGRTELVDIARMFRDKIIPNYRKGTWNDAESQLADTARDIGDVLLRNRMLSGELFHRLWLHACGLEA